MFEAPVEATAVASYVLARYAWAIDDRAYDDLRSVFAVDATADYEAFRCSGVEEIVATMERIHRALLRTQHLVGSVIAAPAADGRIEARSHVRATLVRGAGRRGRVQVSASYRDTLVPGGPAGWLVEDRRVLGHWIAGERSILPWIETTSLCRAPELGD